MAISIPTGRRLFVVISVLVLAFCQFTSYYINSEYRIHEAREIFELTDRFVLYFTHVRNDGAIFGLFQGMGWLVALISAIFLGILVWFVLTSHHVYNLEFLLYALIVGGGSSNILDRVIYGSVIDFLDVKGFSFWNYIFNTADVMIHIGVWPLLIYNWFFLDHETVEAQAQQAQQIQTMQEPPQT